MKTELRRWGSSTDDSFGHELITRPLPPHALASELRQVLADSDGKSFLLARLAATEACGIVAAARAIESLQARVRISLLVDAATIKEATKESGRSAETGLVLDAVTIETPLSAIVCDAVDGVRFDDSFVHSASHDLRANAALRAMVGLARDMALVTFGTLSDDVALESGLHALFDYVTASAAETRVKAGLGALQTLARDSRAR